MGSVLNNFHTFPLLTLFMAVFSYHVELPNLVLNTMFIVTALSAPFKYLFDSDRHAYPVLLDQHLITDFSFFEYFNQCKVQLSQCNLKHLKYKIYFNKI